MNQINKKPKQDEAPGAEDKVLDKLEEMWDRQILKGDDEFYESRVPSESRQTKADLNEKSELVKQRRRRGRKI